MYFISISICIVSFLGLPHISAELFDDCVSPPMECPNENITFWLYTRQNQNDPHQLFLEDPESLETAPWVQGAPVKVLIHGYTENRDSSVNADIRPAYMQCCDYNIISLDYNPIARSPCYIQAASNTELVGKCTAMLIDTLVSKYDIPLDSFHVIGFSLGAETTGFVANYLRSGKLQRITALEPSLPLFLTSDKNKKIDASDAHFVDVLHTNALVNGKLEPCGHIDFYANGGSSQPGCELINNMTIPGCDHIRAPAYYADSINNPNGCYGASCPSGIADIVGRCELDYSDEVLFGEYVPHNSSGVYFFDTNSESPYCRGKNNSNILTSEDQSNTLFIAEKVLV